MFRFRAIAATAMALCLSLVVVAVATARTKVTGGTTSITSSLVASSGITVTPIAPATASGSTFTFPITGGRLNPTTGAGTIRDGGGLTLAGSGHTVNLRTLTVRARKDGKLVLFGRRDVRHLASCVPVSARHPRRRRHCVATTTYTLVRLATATDATVSAGGTTATLDATAYSARIINKLAGKSVATAGAELGTITITPTVA